MSERMLSRWTRAHTVWVAAMAAAVLLGLLPSLAQAQSPEPASAAEPSANLFEVGEPPIPPFVPGAVLAGVRTDVVSAAGLLGDLEVTAVEAIDLHGLDGAQGDAGVTGVRLLVPPGEEWAAIERLQQNPAVVFAEPDWLARIAQAPAELLPAASAAAEVPFAVGDSLYTEQWYLQRIQMSRAWAVAQDPALRGGSPAPVRVAILDTGVDYNHPDLAGRLLPGWNYLATVPGPTPAVDDNGHGTHITGLIGALVNNDGGMAGTALVVELEPIKVLDSTGLGPISRIAQAIRDVTDTGAQIINLSLQVAVDSAVLRSAVDYAASKGVLVIAAAGNCGLSPACPVGVQYPAAYASVLAVAATTYRDEPTYYSASGPEIDIAAPGGGSGYSMLSTWAQLAASKCSLGSTSLLRVVDDGIYCPKDGTSMAAAVVTGVATLVWSLDDDLTAATVRNILQETAAPLNAPRDAVGVGRLDAAMAVRNTIPPRLRVSQYIFTTSVTPGSLPQVLPMTLDNTSLAPMTWTISPTKVVSWYQAGPPIQGIVQYGAPVRTQIVVTPTELLTGTQIGNLWLTATRPDGSSVVQSLEVQATLALPQPLHRVALPVVASGSPVRPSWWQPGAGGRRVVGLTGSSSVGITLPFTITLKGEKIDDLRIHADGFVTLPDTTGVTPLPNRCLANLARPSAGIYGWWADLEPGAPGSQVSTFQPHKDLFVIEYTGVPAAAGTAPSYRVNFQIALHRDGQVDLLYGSMPTGWTEPPQVTVGVRALDGRFYNQVACVTTATEVGDLPGSYKTITIAPEDLF